MIVTLKQGILLVLLLHVIIQPIVEAGAVGGLLEGVLNPVVCLEDATVAILRNVLNAISNGKLGEFVVTALGPVLGDINSTLAKILALLQAEGI